MPARLLAATTIAALAVAAPASAKTVTVTAADRGDTVRAEQGDTIRVSLAANQTTPFKWAVTKRPAAGVARLVGQRYVSPADAPPGAPGRQLYEIRATGAGTTAFRAAYRPLSGGRAAQRFGISIRVRG
ncbi:MAG TPA: protease inhibitor I42 family protein [Capillimicrobium sp.]|jgi:predicted secreted protein